MGPGVSARIGVASCYADGRRRVAETRQLHPPDVRRTRRMPDGERGQAPHVGGTTVHILLDRKENVAPADVFVVVRIEARVPAVPGQLAVGHRHELLTLVAV